MNFFSKIKVLNRYYSGIGTILMLHRVSPFEKDKLFPNENMKISPEFLEKIILELKDKKYEIISLDRLFQILQNNEKVEKQIVFTLDDGYKDNYEIAYPIFKKHNVPFTIYITTSFPQKSTVLWWYVLEDFLIAKSEVTLSNGEIYICRTKQEKTDAFMKIREIIVSFEPKAFLIKLNELFSNYSINWYKYSDDLTMKWEDIQNMSQDEIVTIAGHTSNHFALNRLSKDEILKEVLEANQLIESKIHKKINHFSYPFGSRNEIGTREFEIIKSLNFKTVTTTREGNIYPTHRGFMECMPRVMLVENFDIQELGNIRRKKVITE
jgi:peptidoglycan/xylan/chitin deacetylase (PgdA/CDA1 family)